MFEELKTMNAELAELKAKHLEKSKGLFTAVAAKIFEKHPRLESFNWVQYTPYFNDGDECVFSANTDKPGINGEDRYDINFKDEFITDWGAEKDSKGERPQIKNEKYDLELEAAYEDVRTLLNTLDDSVLRDMFGDHMEITVTKEGTQVDEYSHD